MSLAPQPPETASGLDTHGQFHTGQGMTLGAEGPYIRIRCRQSGKSVLVTGESLDNCIADKYFGRSQIIA